MRNNYLISTGGSGGHVIPAAILCEHLSKESDIIISTDIRGSKYLNKDIYKIKIIDTPKLNNIFFLPLGLIKIIFLTIKSFFLLKNEKITKLISTGGYMSLPLILAGKLLGLKIYLLEPNLVLGRANKYFLNSCYKIFCYTDKIKNFPNHFKNKIAIINPLVRHEIYKKNISKANTNIFNILVVGGSQGASIFDNNLKNTFVNISKNFTIKIFQQTSEKNINYLKNFYSNNNIESSIFSFDKNFYDTIHQADLCITRAGATTLAELSVLNKPFIAVPLPKSKDNHQFENANFYKDNDSCWVLTQDSFEDKIEEVLNGILNNKTDYLIKKDNLKRLNYQNSWINVNQKILRNFNEN
jgi:UDP-N-acetylglucosamine--N-acetylmuramyl-(pentapeptide) pyrophosphoryl-undecaprenol N-acetylglucosamine transferase